MFLLLFFEAWLSAVRELMVPYFNVFILNFHIYSTPAYYWLIQSDKWVAWTVLAFILLIIFFSITVLVLTCTNIIRFRCAKRE